MVRLSYLESTWENQNNASLVSLLDCSVCMLVYEHWTHPLQLKNTSTDSSLEHNKVHTHRKLRDNDDDGGCWLKGTGRLAAFTF